MGGLSDLLQITCVEGHQTCVEAGDSARKIGNDFADVAAKRGTQLRAVLGDAYDEHKKLLKATRQVAAWIGNVQAEPDALGDRAPA
eukprot:1789861-Pyramimonas_sp.AAC.1